MTGDQKNEYFATNASIGTRERILKEAEEYRTQLLEIKKNKELERKLTKLEKQAGGDDMKTGDLVKLMNDDNLIERYSLHLNKILFKYQDVFVRGKYNAYLDKIEPKNKISFFDRMKNDN